MIACSLKQENHTLVVQKMPQWHKLDSKASCEMKVKSLKRKKVRKSNYKFLYSFFFGHRGLIRNNTQTAVTNMTINAFYCHVHGLSPQFVCYKFLLHSLRRRVGIC